ncbi:MAG: CPBP family intramembrane glutamic endopeptidase [Candidatus Omnitrophota bacterium]
MKRSWRFFGVLVAVVLASALLAPILFDFLPYKFERIFNRLVMIGTLVAVVFFVRIGRSTLQDYGLLWERKRSPRILAGFFGAGFGTLFLLLCVKLLFDQAAWRFRDDSLGGYFERLSLSLLSALVIGLIEEFFFRGFVFSSFRKLFKERFVLPLLLTNGLYALIHFINFKKPYIPGDPDFFDSLHLAAAPVLSMRYFPEFWHEAVGLFLFGIVLTLALRRTRSLYSAIGLHAGCVFFVKIQSFFVDSLGKESLWFSSSKMYDGFAGWGFLALLGAGIMVLGRGPKERSS